MLDIELKNLMATKYYEKIEKQNPESNLNRNYMEDPEFKNISYR